MFDTVISGGLLVSAHNGYRPFYGSIGVTDGKIELVTEKQLTAQDGREYIDAAGRIVMPGLINAHCHGDMAAARGLGDGMTLAEQMKFFGERGWFFSVLTPQDRYYARQQTYCEAMLSGTTTLVENMYWSLGENSVKAFAETGLRGAPAEDIRYDFMQSDAFLTQEMLDKLVRLCREKDCIPVLGTLPEEEFTDSRLKTAAKTVAMGGCGFTSHLSETPWRFQYAKEHFGQSPVQVLRQYGLLNERYFGSHGVYLEEEDIETLAQYRCSVVNTPLCELKIADGLAPIRRLCDRGVNVALGTDGAMWNNSNDIFREMKCMALAHNLQKGTPAFTPREILDMATINGAKALGIERETGTLEPGKRADIILIDAEAPHMTPLHTGEKENITSALVFCACGRDVTDVMIGGRLTVRDRKITTCNLRKIQEYVKDSSQRVRQTL